MPHVFDWRTATDLRAGVQQAVQALQEGQLVAFPTESVYGIAASLHAPAAVERLVQYKGRASGPPLPLALGDAAQVLDWVPEMGTLGRRLARRCWPGPVTLVCSEGVERGQASHLTDALRQRICPQGTLGLRVPDHPAIQEVLRGVSAPLVLTSTRTNGSPAATTAEEVLSSAGDTVGLVINDGRTRHGQDATVIAVRNGDWQLVREGVFSAADVQELSARVIVFVCTGNTCRSPLAEGLCKKLLSERLGCTIDELVARGYLVLSAGLAALPGDSAAPEAIEVARAHGVDLTGHISQPLTDDLVIHADSLITMTRLHAVSLLGRFGGHDPRPRLLCQDGSDIDDPIGCDATVYRACAEQIIRQLESILADLA